MNIIQIDRIYNSQNGICIGFIGLDDNKRYRYFIFWNENDVFDNRGFREFNPDRVPKNSNLYQHLCYSKVPILKFTDDIDPELIDYTYDAITIHERYNEKFGFPTEMLSSNKTHLNVSVDSSDKELYDLHYHPVKNNIIMCMNPLLWKYATENKKKKTRMAIVHEIGHMKVSSYNYSDTHKKLISTCGFNTDIIPTKSILLPNGDIFHQNLGLNADHTYTFALEELINDFDCSLAMPGFEPNYPTIGKDLNDLCDGKLLKARYAHDATILPASLLAIDDNDALVEDFLLHLRNSVCGDDPITSENHTRRLIQHYSERKRK